MQREHSIWLEAFSSYARVCARSIVLQITLISLLFFAPAFAASGFETALTELKSADLKTQFDGLEKIKPFRTPAAARALAKSAVREQDANFRLAALDQIAALHISAVVPDLGPLLKDKMPAIRQRTARVIGMVGGPSAEPLLLSAIGKETDASVKGALIQALGLCGSAQSDAALNAAATDADPAIRANAIHAHERIQGAGKQKAK